MPGPESASHKQQHSLLLKNYMMLEAKLESGHILISQESRDFLHEWIKRHILEKDMKLGQYLNAKGVYLS